MEIKTFEGAEYPQVSGLPGEGNGGRVAGDIQGHEAINVDVGSSGWFLASYNVSLWQSYCNLSWTHVNAQKGMVVVCSESFHLP